MDFWNSRSILLSGIEKRWHLTGKCVHVIKRAKADLEKHNKPQSGHTGDFKHSNM